RWTQLENFQSTRGILRTFALALRDAEKWDQGPLVGANVFLNRPGETELTAAARELAGTAAQETYEGRRQGWSAILVKELAIARGIQPDYPQGCPQRELEQAVLATFLFSQPTGQKATLRDLRLLLGPTDPDKIPLEEALKRWAVESWFLDDQLTGVAGGTRT